MYKSYGDLEQETDAMSDIEEGTHNPYELHNMPLWNLNFNDVKLT